MTVSFWGFSSVITIFFFHFSSISFFTFLSTWVELTLTFASSLSFSSIPLPAMFSWVKPKIPVWKDRFDFLFLFLFVFLLILLSSLVFGFWFVPISFWIARWKTAPLLQKRFLYLLPLLPFCFLVLPLFFSIMRSPSKKSFEKTIFGGLTLFLFFPNAILFNFFATSNCRFLFFFFFSFCEKVSGCFSFWIDSLSSATPW